MAGMLLAVVVAGFFRVPGSPLDGKRVPRGWNGLNWQGKVQALVKLNWAKDFGDGARQLQRHGKASAAAAKRGGSRATAAHYSQID